MDRRKCIKARRIIKGNSSRRRQSLLVDDDNDTSRISSLPDCLLLEILSRLEFERQVQTSLVSKRWRYLWTFADRLDFSFLDTGDKDKDIGIIDRCLSHHQKTKVRELYFLIMYEEKHRLSVDSWIRFAIQTKVESLMLDLNLQTFPDDEFRSVYPDYVMYKLPDILFKCGSSFTKLGLRYCQLELPATINLESLKVLSLYYIDLPSDAIEQLTSGCPILEELNLEGCNRFSHLNITIKNEHVKILKLDEFIVEMPLCGSITLDAPNVLLLKFDVGLPRKQYHLKNLHSVTSVDLSTVTQMHINDDNELAEVLHGLRHVKKLKLSSPCIQNLSLRKIEGLDPLSLQATDIHFSVLFSKWELPGIAYLLQSAYSLENLTISIAANTLLSEIAEEFTGVGHYHDFDGKSYWKLQESSFLTLALQNIKTIKIKEFHRYRGINFTNLSGPNDECLENEMEFVRFLLNNAKALKQMVIKTVKIPHDRSTNLKLKKTVTQKLKSFTKASPNAELLIT